MGFFPNIFKGSPTKIISHIVAPGLYEGVETLKWGVQTAKPLLQAIKPSPPAVHEAPKFKAMYGPQPLVERQPAYGQMSYPQYYGGGGGYAPSFDFPPAQPSQPFYGGSPWDFSTTSQVYSPQPSPTYSALRERTWEDLSTVALPLLATFL